MTHSSKEPYNKNTGKPDITTPDENHRIQNVHPDQSGSEENCGTALAVTNTGNEEVGRFPDENQQKNDQTSLLKEEANATTEVEELSSDGSASAFEGTESIDSHDQDLILKRKAEQLKNDPSGRSYY